jgi:(p)ppGpp synthase/HD superfamily hydrolase
VQEILNNAYAKGDKEVLLIKCIDRLHNMQTIGAKTPEKIAKTVKETLSLFLLLSEYLGLRCTSNAIKKICMNHQKETDSHNIDVTYNFSFNDNYQPLFLIYQND